MTNPAAQAYHRTQRASLKGRPSEAQVFAKAVALLNDAQARPGDRSAYRDALVFNQNLWTVVQAGLIEPACQLPDGLKSDLLSVSLFVDRQTFAAMASPAAAGNLQPLIEIDRDVAAGLFSKPS